MNAKIVKEIPRPRRKLTEEQREIIEMLIEQPRGTTLELTDENRTTEALKGLITRTAERIEGETYIIVTREEKIYIQKLEKENQQEQEG